MAITRDQALTLSTFHRPVAGGARCYVLRRNGQTQTWRTRVTHYRVPVKYGMYEHGYVIAPEMVATAGYGTAPQPPNGDNVYAPADCPVCHGTKR